MRPHMRTGVAALVAVFAVAVAGCGSNNDYKNQPRPPSPIVLTASISKDKVSVSPANFGAGPVSLIITNLTGAPQEVTFESNAGGSGAFSQKTGPINPQDTATVKADVPQGGAVVKVAAGAIKSAPLKIGPQRKSSQDQLLLP
jgi:hypothetical protein